MPKKKLTFLIVPDSTSEVRQFKCTRAFIGFVGCLAVLVVAGIGMVVQDYFRLRDTLPARSTLQGEIASQRAQLQIFSKKIKDMASEMMALHDFEKKLRLVANVEADGGDGEAVFGIGGAADESLEDLLVSPENHKDVIREMHARTERLAEFSARQKNAFEELHGTLQERKSILASTPSIKPTTGWMSSGFGYRKSPFTGRREFHRGLDIATRKGTPVVAAADGVVTYAQRKGGLGKLVVIDHGHGFVTRYGHLNEFRVEQGQRVKRGDEIAKVGNTGRSTAPHVHYEVHINGVPVNPSKYILN